MSYSFHNALTERLNIQFPLIMAPMFLVSNQAMIEAAVDAGIMGTIPTLNFRKDQDLEAFFVAMNHYCEGQNKPGNWGVNLIVHDSNKRMQAHLALCEKYKVPMVITSLGNPTEVVQRVKAYGGATLCDVTNIKHADKAARAGCDGFIVVGAGAGGHAGPEPLHVIGPAIKKRFPDQIVTVAGGISTGQGIAGMLTMGLDGVSMGTRFIATEEAAVGPDYKEAVVTAGIDDIAMTDRLSGVPCAIIITPDKQDLRLEMSLFEKLVATQPWLKKLVKRLQKGAMKNLLDEKVLMGKYNEIWSAGKSVEFVDQTTSCKVAIEQLKEGFLNSVENMTTRLRSDQ